MSHQTHHARSAPIRTPNRPLLPKIKRGNWHSAQFLPVRSLISSHRVLPVLILGLHIAPYPFRTVKSPFLRRPVPTRSFRTVKAAFLIAKSTIYRKQKSLLNPLFYGKITGTEVIGSFLGRPLRVFVRQCVFWSAATRIYLLVL